MSDRLSEDLAAFDAMLGVEEAAPEGTPAPESDLPPAQLDQVAEPPDQPDTDEPPAEVQDDRPRDEQGRFTKTEPEGESEMDWKERYENLQSVFGRQGQELGELRQTLEKLNENLAPREPEPQQLQINQGTIDWFDEQVEQNAQAAAMWAAENDPSGTLYDRAVDYWYDENPRQAAAFERRQEMANLAKEWEQRFKQETAPLQALSTQNAIEQAWSAAREKFPDLDDRAQQIIEAAQRAPKMAEGLQSEDPAERVSTIENLYYFASGLAGMTTPAATGGTPDASAEAAAAALTQQARDAKLSGTVASQTTTSDPQQVDEGEAWLQRFYDPVAARFQHDE